MNKRFISLTENAARTLNCTDSKDDYGLKWKLERGKKNQQGGISGKGCQTDEEVLE